MNTAKPFVLYFRFVTQNNWHHSSSSSGSSTGGDGVGNSSNSMVCTLEKDEALVILAEKLEGYRHYL